MRLGFATCVRLGLEVLDEILDQGSTVDAVVTLHDGLSPAKSGRVQVDTMAARHGANLHKTGDINDPNTIDWLRRQELDWLFIIGWSQIATTDVLAIPRRGSIGMHPTILPAGRGRASIPWAIIKGMDRTGVTMFALDDGVDTGPILDSVLIPISRRETASTLYESVVKAHRQLIASNLRSLLDGSATFSPQSDESASVWPARTPADGELKQSMSLRDIDAMVRALAPPYPPAWWVSGDGHRWEILQGTPEGQFAPEGSLRISAADGDYFATMFKRVTPSD